MKTIELLKEQDLFIKNLEFKGKSYNTIKNYKTDLNCFNKFIDKNKPNLKITDLSSAEAQEYSRFLINTYSSPNSIRRRVQALRIFFDFLIEKGDIDSNPIKKVVVAPKLIEAPTPVHFKEIKALHDFLITGINQKSNLEGLLFLRNKIIFDLIFTAGLKVSDLTILKRSNILKDKNGHYRVLVNHPKKDPFTVALNPSFNSFFDQYQIELIKQKNKDNIEFSNLFFNSNPYSILSGNISPRGIEILFKELSKKTKTKITAKTLRQACIVKWILQNKPQSSIKEWMGVQPVYSLKSYIELSKSAHYLDFNEEYIVKVEPL